MPPADSPSQIQIHWQCRNKVHACFIIMVRLNYRFSLHDTYHTGAGLLNVRWATPMAGTFCSKPQNTQPMNKKTQQNRDEKKVQALHNKTRAGNSYKWPKSEPAAPAVFMIISRWNKWLKVRGVSWIIFFQSSSIHSCSSAFSHQRSFTNLVK